MGYPVDEGRKGEVAVLVEEEEKEFWGGTPCSHCGCIDNCCPLEKGNMVAAHWAVMTIPPSSLMMAIPALRGAIMMCDAGNL